MKQRRGSAIQGGGGAASAQMDASAAGLQGLLGNAGVQEMAASGGLVHRRAAGAAPTGDVGEVARGGFNGAPGVLPHRGEMERLFGQSFGDVQAYTGEQAAAANESLGAQAYALGDQIAFSEANPSREVVAHELTHVVQDQRQGGGEAMGRVEVDSPSSAAEREAHAVESAVRGDGPMPEISQRAQGGLSRLAALGTVTYNQSFGGASGTINVRSRTVDEWKEFLRNEADTSAGSQEICAFMAWALGRQRAFGGMTMTMEWNGSAPNQTQSVDLMVALMTAGTSLDLPDAVFEGEGMADANMSSLLTEFNARFAASAIERISREREMTQTDVEGVEAYAQQGEAMRYERPDSTTFNPGGDSPTNTLITASLATAVGAAGQVFDADSNEAANDAYTLMRNACKTMSGALQGAERERASRVTALRTTFSTVASAVPVSGFAANLVKQAFKNSALASSFFDDLVGGRQANSVRSLQDQFANATRDLGSVDADRLQIVRNIFNTEIRY